MQIALYLFVIGLVNIGCINATTVTIRPNGDCPSTYHAELKILVRRAYYRHRNVANALNRNFKMADVVARGMDAKWNSRSWIVVVLDSEFSYVGVGFCPVNCDVRIAGVYFTIFSSSSNSNGDDC